MNFLRNLRQAVNPPYTKGDLVVLATLAAIIFLIPLVVLVLSGNQIASPYSSTPTNNSVYIDETKVSDQVYVATSKEASEETSEEGGITGRVKEVYRYVASRVPFVGSRLVRQKSVRVALAPMETGVQIVSDELLVKIKDKSKVDEEVDPVSVERSIKTAVESFYGKRGKTAPTLLKVEKLLTPTEKSDLSAAIFRWYKVKFSVASGNFKGDFDPRTGDVTGSSAKAKTMNDIMDALREASLVEVVEPKGTFYQPIPIPTVEPPDKVYLTREDYLNQPAFKEYNQIKSSTAALASQTSADPLVVAVLDTGVNPDHPDLKNRMWANPSSPATGGWKQHGAEFISNVSHCIDTPPKLDPYKTRYGADLNEGHHGSMVAGVIAGLSGAQIMDVQVTHIRDSGGLRPIEFTPSVGTCSESAIRGMQFAIENGADIINIWPLQCSWFSSADIVEYAHQKGIVMVAESYSNYQILDPLRTIPFGSKEVITVTALTSDDKLPSFANVGYKIDVAAPGVDIVSTSGYLDPRAAIAHPLCSITSDPKSAKGYGYCTFSSTTMAAPFVTALAANIRVMNPHLTPEQMRQVIRRTAIDLTAHKAAVGRDLIFGWGKLGYDALEGEYRVPEVYIESPRNLFFIESSEVIGTANAGSGSFASYKLEYAEPCSTGRNTYGLYTDEMCQWRVLSESSQPVTNGVIGSVPPARFDKSGGLNKEAFGLRLTVRDQEGREYISEVFPNWYGYQPQVVDAVKIRQKGANPPPPAAKPPVKGSDEDEEERGSGSGICLDILGLNLGDCGKDNED